MARVVRRRWPSDLSAPSRAARRGCDYEAYVPDPLVGRPVVLDGPVAADVAAAEAAMARFDVEASALGDTESLARILLRAESVASSRIEGLHVGARRLLRAEVARESEDGPADVTAAEVLGNIDAMVFGVGQVDPDRPVTKDLLLEVHRRLLAGTALEGHGGRVRASQNWIGGSDYNPCAAAFVPPPPELVDRFLDDLVAFANGDSLPAVAQAAMVHAQFETIHPFVDGNGRTGRVLVHLVLRRRGLALQVLPPVSLVLVAGARDYVEGLMATRYRGSVRSVQAREGTNQWVGRFAGACLHAVEDAVSFERQVQEIEAGWRARLGRLRARSAADLLLRALPGAPVVTVTGAAELIGRSFVQTNEAVTRLAEAGVLHQVTVGRRNRAFEAPEVIAAFGDLERRLATPG